MAFATARPAIRHREPAGAGSNIGAEVVAGASDGYSLLYATTANAINATLYDKLNFNFIRDIAPVAGIIRVPNLVSINLSVPIKTIAELVAYARANRAAELGARMEARSFSPARCSI